jgi:aminoglycoside phosphotransferase (APT) family kinase protein
MLACRIVDRIETSASAAGIYPTPVSNRHMSETSAGEEGVRRIIADRITERCSEWFPEISKPVVQFDPPRIRPKGSLYPVRLGVEDPRPRILAKVRYDDPSGPEPSPSPNARPRLHAVPVSAEEYTRLEYSGLRAIEDAVGAREPDIAAVRALDVLPRDAVVLMEFVRGTTLRDALLADSRLRSLAARRHARSAPLSLWRTAGRWLRRFHDFAEFAERPASQATRDDVTSLYPQYGRYLGGRLGDPTVEKIACAAGEFAASVLPESLPLVVGHGDFAPRNVLVVDHGALAVLDPMPRWRVPRFEDIARFTVGMRLVAPQIYSLGGAFSRSDLDRREAHFLAGYHGDEPIPVQAIRSYQALIVMDKWAALVSSQRASHSRFRRGVFWAFNRYLRREASRLLTPDDGAVAS